MWSAETGFGGTIHSPVESWSPAKPADWVVWSNNAEPVREEIYQDQSGSGPPSPLSTTPGIANIASAPSNASKASTSPALPFSRSASRVTSREGVSRRSHGPTTPPKAEGHGDLHDNPIFRRRSNEGFDQLGAVPIIAAHPNRKHRASIGLARTLRCSLPAKVDSRTQRRPFPGHSFFFFFLSFYVRA